MSTLNQDQIKVLEQSRQRLVQLTRSLGSLIASLNQSDPLPQWSSLQSQASIISNNLISVSEHLSEHSDLLSTLVAYPGPEYPGRTQANTLEQLLRTKLDPRVEDWVARGRVTGTDPTQAPGFNTGSAENKPLTEAELSELWEWAPFEANQEARRRNWGGNYTLEEREGPGGIQAVVTGLKRTLEDDEGDSDEEEDEGDEGEDEMEVVGVHRKSGGGSGLEYDIAVHHAHAVEPVVPLGEILRYMTTGRMP
ncbi:uncharacterized protein N7484_011557 [Penicillium longicatenatum]|uniref:uncharacterized protein n=1 Tax=Penicillium longicatenatum TaxID=1561947 RepID=UPI002549BA20|nr:uncharacterized protein N7484_011557 [Penicillium longicatenatum]KAJ5631457.1 hypothetical protein N7484_011557 [Penicillium longicatenatum]